MTGILNGCATKTTRLDTCTLSPVRGVLFTNPCSGNQCCLVSLKMGRGAVTCAYGKCSVPFANHPVRLFPLTFEWVMFSNL